MEKYALLLRNEKTKSYRRISWILILSQFVVFLYFSIYASAKEIRHSYLASVIILAVVFLLYLYFRGSRYRFGFYPFFLVIMLEWIRMEQYWIAGLTLLLSILSRITERKLVLTIERDHILYPSYPPRKIQWNSLSNVLVKDGLLTIDFKNNHIIQQLVEKNISEANEAEINDFCRQQLKAPVNP
jgi:hypothetical protein